MKLGESRGSFIKFSISDNICISKERKLLISRTLDDYIGTELDMKIWGKVDTIHWDAIRRSKTFAHRIWS